MCRTTPNDIQTFLRLEYPRASNHFYVEMLSTQACALVPDIIILEDGDESEIGEQGVSQLRGPLAGNLRLNVLVRSTYQEVKKREVSIVFFHHSVKNVLIYAMSFACTSCLFASIRYPPG